MLYPQPSGPLVYSCTADVGAAWTICNASISFLSCLGKFNHAKQVVLCIFLNNCDQLLRVQLYICSIGAMLFLNQTRIIQNHSDTPNKYQTLIQIPNSNLLLSKFLIQRDSNYTYNPKFSSFDLVLPFQIKGVPALWHGWLIHRSPLGLKPKIPFFEPLLTHFGDHLLLELGAW